MTTDSSTSKGKGARDRSLVLNMLVCAVTGAALFSPSQLQQGLINQMRRTPAERTHRTIHGILVVQLVPFSRCTCLKWLRMLCGRLLYCVREHLGRRFVQRIQRLHMLPPNYTSIHELVLTWTWRRTDDNLTCCLDTQQTRSCKIVHLALQETSTSLSALTS